MRIYKYNPNCEEWANLRESKLQGEERDNAFKECMAKIGTELTLEEYFSLPLRHSDWRIGVCYGCVGKPDNVLEELAYAEMEYVDKLSYCHVRENRPEDLTENRTDWNDMMVYADGMASFIDRLKGEIGNGKLKYGDN